MPWGVLSAVGSARGLAACVVVATLALAPAALAQEGDKKEPEKPANPPATQPASTPPASQPATQPAATPPAAGQPAPATPGEPSNLPPEVQEQLRKIREDAAKYGAKFTMPGQANPTAPAPAPTPVKQVPPGTVPNPGGKPPSEKASDEKHAGGKLDPSQDAKDAKPVAPVKPVDVKPPVTSVPQPAPVSTPAPGVSHSASSLDGPVPEGMVRLEFTDAVDVLLLVKFVRESLDLQLIVMDSGLVGQKVTFTDPIMIKREKLLPFLVEVLESKDYTIVQNATGIYVVQPRAQTQPAIGDGPFMTTRIIRTPNMRPSQLQTVITNLLAGARGPAAGPAGAPTYMDDLGVIIMTDTPRVTGLVQSLVDELVKERTNVDYTRFELNHIAASSARDRVLELMGQATQRISINPGQPGQPAPIPTAPVTSTSNLNERLTVDPSSNALWFRGREDETRMVADLLHLVDVANALVSRFYPVGLSTAEAVANAGTKEQLGGVTTFESSSGRGGTLGAGASRVNTGGIGGPGAATDFTGAGFVLYPEAGGFIYRGTPAQHERVQSLIAGLKDLSERDKVAIEFYKLKHGKAEDVASVVQNLLTNSTPSGNRGGLLGRDLGGGNTNRNRTNPRQPNQPNQPAAAAAAGAGGEAPGLGEINGEDVFVIADEGNNQVVVKAPAKLQPQFKQLIQRIDLRRPQVYLDAKIVVVSSTEGLDVTTEVQQIIGQFALNTNFGLGSLTSTSGTTTTGGLTSPKIPNTGLSGVTAALIRSKDVPFLINALARNVDGRVVATPQLLVDDNSEAEIKSKDQQPTSTTTLGTNGQNNTTSFGGFEEAGPSLKIKPQIADGGYLRLEYEIELSSFTGSPSGGLPSPKQTNNVKSESVTVPTDQTIVVGGLVSENAGKTILKIPLLGDIPIVGELFRDTSITKTRTNFFVFITPKIMRDPSFADLRLITSKPLVALDLPSELPPAEPVRIDVLDTAAVQTRQRETDAVDENKRRETNEPRKKKPRSDTDPWN